LVVTVIADALQLIVAPQLTVPQANTVTSEVIVNRAGTVAPVTLQIDNLPTGASASFTPVAAGSNTVTLSLTASAAVPAGTYATAVRAIANGIADVVSPVALQVVASGVTVAVTPSTANVFQGSTATLAVLLTRQTFGGAVRLSVEGVPNGLTITPTPASVVGDSARLVVAAASAMAPGDYDVTLRAAPVGLLASAERTVPLRLSVRPVAGGVGNVLLDWSACETPAWIAVQDGNGPWQRVLPTAGAVRFSVTTGRGGYAYLDGARTVNVRYQSQAELSAAPIAVCAPRVSGRRVTGTSLHTGPGEIWNYVFGGLPGLTTSALPDFSISDVPPGPHDLIGWTQFGTTYRYLLRRGLNPADGESVGTMSLLGPDAFFSVQRNMSVTAVFASGESLSHSLDYLTTAACTVNPLFTRGPIGTTFTTFGIPEPYQLPTDFHQVTVRAAGSQGIRSISTVMHALEGRNLPIPPLVPTLDVRTLAGPYKRLQATIASLPGTYNGPLELRYQDGLQVMSVAASSAYAGTGGVVLTMPDFSAVAGWLPAAAIRADAAVQWTMQLDGGDLALPPCTEGRTTVRTTRLGTL
jgi:hypothetical protein